MSSWSEVRAAASDLAKAVQVRFDATGLGLLATLRRDGSPRICPVEPMFADDLWLGMMEGSRKAADLLRDPRFALHAATADKQVSDGDAKVSGLAVVVNDPDTVAAYRRGFADHTGYDLPDETFHLFRADVKEISFLKPGSDHLVIEWWKEGGVPQRVERR